MNLHYGLDFLLGGYCRRENDFATVIDDYSNERTLIRYRMIAARCTKRFWLASNEFASGDLTRNYRPETCLESRVSPKKVNQIYRILADSTPTPTTELRYSSPFELLIAVILSAQATDVSVNRATAQLYRVANTASGIRKLGLRKLKSHIRTIGLYNTKATNIIRTCRILDDKHGGKVPSTRQELEALPGVGRKTANVVLNTAFGQSTIAVDTHIFRVSNRTGLARGKTVLDVEKNLLDVTPESYCRDAHHLLILHGRYTCTARNPRCPDCRIQKFCEFIEKRTV